MLTFKVDKKAHFKKKSYNINNSNNVIICLKNTSYLVWPLEVGDHHFLRQKKPSLKNYVETVFTLKLIVTFTNNYKETACNTLN